MPTSPTGNPLPAAPADTLHVQGGEPVRASCLACDGGWPSTTHFFASLGVFARLQEQELQ